GLYQALIAERDRYMAARLREVAQRSQSRQLLAVVGAGHLSGLATHLLDPVDPARERAALDALPPARSRLWRLLPWLVVAVILAGFAIGFARTPQLGWQLVVEWVLINGTLSALGAAAALAHPLTVLAAFLA